MKKIVIYADQGTSPYSVSSIIWALESLDLSRKFIIEKVTKDYFKLDTWEKQTALIIFPGGKDLPYHEALQGEALKQIRRFIENGGKYLGICAGAYFGCEQIEFEKGGPLEVLGKRDLCFFPGKAIGPAYGLNKFSYTQETGACLAQLNFTSKSPSYDAKIYFNGGCSFELPQENLSIKPIACYTNLPDQPLAIIQCQIGEGLALLSGVHPEFSALHEEAKHRMTPSIYNELLENEKTRSNLFSDLIDILLN